MSKITGDINHASHVQHKQICSDQAESPLGSYEELSWLTDEGGKLEGMDGQCAQLPTPSK